MSNFPYLDQIPAHNIVTILAKMNLPESSKMLQTCRFVKDTVELPKKRPAFFVEQITLLQCEMMCTEYVSPLEVDDYLQRQLRCSEKARKSLRIDNVIMEGYSDYDYVARIEKSRIKCYRLVVEHGIIEDDVLPQVHRASGASAMWVTYKFGQIDPDPIPKGVSFNVVKQLSIMGCKDLVIDYGEELPYNSNETLSQFELVHVTNTMERNINFTIIPLIKQMLTNSTIPLRYFWLPVFDKNAVLWEFREMGLDKWKLNFRSEIYTDYLIETEEDYVILILMDHLDNVSCICHRISKKEEIDEIVIGWFEHHASAQVPFDASGLYELFLNGKFKRIKKNLRKILEQYFCR